MVKVLLDTNIIIEREANCINSKDIGILFNWLDKLQYEKCIHNLTIEEIKKHKDEKVRNTFMIKLNSYTLLKTEAPQNLDLLEISKKIDVSINDLNDTRLLNELASTRVDFLITGDKKIHQKAKMLKIESKVFTIESFLEKVTSENPAFVDYKTLSVKKEYFGNINIFDEFFDDFRKDYQGFNDWFNKKSEEPAYVCKLSNKILAFLYIKKEDEKEDYSSITPIFQKKKRIKIGTFKVMLNGYKLGERFLKIVFDNALKQRVDEIYVTIFNNNPEKDRLINLLSEWGFVYWGKKNTSSGEENVYIRDFHPTVNIDNPKVTFPFFSLNSRVFFVSIYPQYHTSLLPDSLLNTESPEEFVENEPFRNAISKVYITRSFNKDIKSGDLIVFYRTGGLYKGVITTIGIVDSVNKNITDETEFISLCRKRSVFNNKELSDQWNYQYSKPFTVNFLYAYSFPHRMNLKELIDSGVISGVGGLPRGFESISKEKFKMILEKTATDSWSFVQ